MAVAFAGHFMGNVLTGRAKKRFIKWQWPAHDHIPPPAPRIAHMTHVVGMFGLAFTGLYIHLPFFVGGRTAMRNIHYVLMVIVTVNLIYRLYYAFFSKNRDFREFGLRWIDIKAIPATIKYYIFIASDKPHLSKYNPMQRITYTIFPLLLIVQAFTGFSIAFPVFFYGWASPFFGISAAAAYARLAHYLINWLFIILTTAHFYLSLTEDFPAFLLFFFQIEPEHAPAHAPEVALDQEVPAPEVHLPVPQEQPQIEQEPVIAYVPPGFDHPSSEVARAKAKPEAEVEEKPEVKVDVGQLTEYLDGLNGRMASMEELLKKLGTEKSSSPERPQQVQVSTPQAPASDISQPKVEPEPPTQEEPEPW